MATAGLRPRSVRGSCVPMETARSGDAARVADWQRAVQPAVVASFVPGVPDSMKSCASKCDASDRASRSASMIASCPLSQSGLSGWSDGCSPKRPSRSMAPFVLPGSGTAIVGRSS